MHTLTKLRFTGFLLALLLPLIAACGSTGTGSPTKAPDAATSAPAAATKAPEATTAPAAATKAPEATKAPSTSSGAGVALPEVDPAAVKGNIVTAGSSTVFPLSQRMAERFKDEGFSATNGNITIDSIGTGAGFERFCKAGETDIANASRAIKDEEKKNCEAIGRKPIEFRIGTDAMAIVVSKENTFLKNVTIEQLAKLFTGEVKMWNELDPSYPAQKVQLFSPGSDSGTYDFFVEVILKKDDSKLQTSGAQFSENDSVLVKGIEGSPYAIGYFGYAYLKEEGDKLHAVSVEGVEPNEQTAESGKYKLARPLFLYSDAKIMKDKPQVAAFINFYLTYVNDEIKDVGYFPAFADKLDAARQAWLDAQK